MLLGLAAYVVFLIASLPASVVWNYAVDFSAAPELDQKVSRFEGSIWNGRANIHVEGLSYPVAWRVLPSSVWRLRLELGLSSHQDSLNVDARAFVSPFGIGLRELRAKISESLINHSLEPMSASMTNPVFINVQELDWSWGDFSKAAGRITWEGGMVSYRVGRNNKELPVPGMAGLLSSQDGNLALTFATSASAGAEELLVARLDGDGMGALQVRRRLLDLVGQRWAANSQADDIIFEVSQPLWN